MPVSLKELQLPSIASLRAIAALRSPHLALVRPARIGLGFESAAGTQKTLAEIEEALGGPGRLSLPYSLRWLLDVLTGLGVLHRTLGFVHGEVQPEHVALGEDGIGRLIPVVRAHWVRGEERLPERLYYLAPEKLLGDSIDARSDVFSVGVMLWEALQGQRRMEATRVDDIISRLMSGGIPRAQAPEGEAWTLPLADIAERALALDPERRFASVAEMKDALQAACARYLASPPGMAELFANPERRARSNARDSLAPESQRVTVPPPSIEPEQETKRNPVVAEETIPTSPTSAKLPYGKTLVGVAPPFIERRTPAPESSVTKLTMPVGTPAPVIAPRASAPPPVAPRTPQPVVAEPTFELVRPRSSSRGALWLVAGALFAIAAFAARPWLAQQVAAVTGALPDTVTPSPDSEPVVRSTAPRPALSVALPQPSNTPEPVTISSTPPSPTDRGAPRPRMSRQEQRHVVADTAPPIVNPPAPEPAPAPAAPPPTPETETAEPEPPPAPKPKPAPASDADRYGI